MRDSYPEGSSIPGDYLVPTELQPDFLELPGTRLPDFLDLGTALADGNVDAGRAGQIAVVHAETDRGYTFGELAQGSKALAAGLVRLGLVPGDRVLLRSRNVPEALLLAVACWKAGLVVVPTPVVAHPTELAFFIDDTEPRAVFVSDAAAADGIGDVLSGTTVEHVFSLGEAPVAGARPWTDLFAEPAELAPVSTDAVAVIWHTGGSTGAPKAIYHTHRRLILGGYALAEATGAGPGQVWTACAPIGHALGFSSMTTFTVLHGASAVLIEDFADPAIVLAAIARYRVFGMVAMMLTWSRMLDALRDGDTSDVSSLGRVFGLWQSSASEGVRSEWLNRGVDIKNNFGCTSFSSWILVPELGDGRADDSLGIAVPGYEVIAIEVGVDDIQPVAVGNPGQLAARGVSGLTYWRRPELQRRDVRDGWVLIDDMAVFATDGRATHQGRTDSVISSAGHKIPPIEIENALATHPAVAEAAVVGAPDALRGEQVFAFVVLRDGAEGDDRLVRELQDHVKTQLAAYKYPRRIEFVSGLPRDHVGKPQVKVLRTRAAEVVAQQTEHAAS